MLYFLFTRECTRANVISACLASEQGTLRATAYTGMAVVHIHGQVSLTLHNEYFVINHLDSLVTLLQFKGGFELILTSTFWDTSRCAIFMGTVLSDAKEI